MAKKKKHKQDKPFQASEPPTDYASASGNKTVSFFSSFEEVEEDNYKWLATLTPEQHLQNATAHIKRIFATHLKKNPHLGSKVTFD